MLRRRQSELIAPPSADFQPGEAFQRISFLDLIGDGPHAPLHTLEPAYVDGSTLIAVWPDGDPVQVQVRLWAPDELTMQVMHALQIEWPPAFNDLLVRRDAFGVAIFRPSFTCYARTVTLSRTERAHQVRCVLQAGARSLGRTHSLAA